MSRTTTNLCRGATIAAAFLLLIPGVADAQSNDEYPDRSDRRQSQRDADRDDSRRERSTSGNTERNRANRNSNDNTQTQSERSERERERVNERDDYNRSEQMRNQDAYNRRGDSREGQRSRDYSQSDRQSGNRSSNGWMGLTVYDDRGQGVLIRRVAPNSPAQRAGLRVGDRITRIQNEWVQSVDEFQSRIDNLTVGEQVEIEADRNRIERAYMVRVGDQGSRDNGRSGERNDARQNRWAQDRWAEGQVDSRTTYGAEETQYGQRQRVESQSQQALSRRVDSLERRLERMSNQIDNLVAKLDSRSTGNQSSYSSDNWSRNDSQSRRTGYRGQDEGDLSNRSEDRRRSDRSSYENDDSDDAYDEQGDNDDQRRTDSRNRNLSR